MTWKAERIGGSHRGAKEKGMAFRIIDADAGNRFAEELAIVYNKPVFEDAERNALLMTNAQALLEVLRDVMKAANPHTPMTPGEKVVCINRALGVIDRIEKRGAL